MSNTERQRLFRQRHPGYYQRLHANRRAVSDAGIAAMEQEKALSAIAPRVMLMLPAPVETIDIPGMTTIGSAAIPVFVERG